MLVLGLHVARGHFRACDGNGTGKAPGGTGWAIAEAPQLGLGVTREAELQWTGMSDREGLLLFA